MKSNLKFKFTASIWVTGSFNGEYVIGRTCMLDGQKTLAIVTESGAPQLVLFDIVQDLKKLSILSKNAPPITSSIYDRENITIEERLIVEVLKSINSKN